MFGDVTSANVVGYKNESVPGEYGFKAVAFNFDDVATANQLSLANIQGSWDIDDSIQIFDENGNVKEALTYKKKGSKTGWYYTIESTSSAADHVFKRGESAWFCLMGDGGFVQSGAVNMDGMEVDVNGDYGFTQTGNVLAVPLKLSKIQFGEVNIDDSIQIFDENGNVKEALTYKKKGSKTGWYYTIESTSSAADHVFEPGDSFFTCFANATKMTIPSIAEAQAE